MMFFKLKTQSELRTLQKAITFIFNMELDAVNELPEKDPEYAAMRERVDALSILVSFVHTYSFSNPPSFPATIELYPPMYNAAKEAVEFFLQLTNDCFTIDDNLTEEYVELLINLSVLAERFSDD